MSNPTTHKRERIHAPPKAENTSHAHVHSIHYTDKTNFLGKLTRHQLVFNNLKNLPYRDDYQIWWGTEGRKRKRLQRKQQAAGQRCALFKVGLRAFELERKGVP